MNSTMNKTVKLIRVMNGLYRTESGGIRVAYCLPWRGEAAHWEVRYTNWMSVEICVKFRTLSEARVYLNEMQRESGAS